MADKGDKSIDILGLKPVSSSIEKVTLYHGDAPVAVQPRIAHSVFDDGSWIQDEVVHSMWAGLLASACDENGGDDSNVIFIGILKQLTAMQVRVLRFAIERADKYVSKAGWPYAEIILCPISTLKEICGADDMIRLGLIENSTTSVP